MRTFLLIAAAGAGAWLVLAAAGAPCAMCAWCSGSAAALAVSAAARPRAARFRGAAFPPAAMWAARLAARAGAVPAALARLRYAAAYRYLNSVSRRVPPDAETVILRPGRLVRPLVPSDDEERGW